MFSKQLWSFAAVAFLYWSKLGVVQAFVLKRTAATRSSNGPRTQGVVRHAKPQRISENVEGVVYVNDKCINCAACSNFAPKTFARSSSEQYHIVAKQPETHEEILHARAALAACPVSAIRVETLAERRHRAAGLGSVVDQKRIIEQEWSDKDQELVRLMGLNVDKSGLEKPFPRPFLAPKGVSNVYSTGHHNHASFGAVPYLVRTSRMSDHNKPVWIMVDTPRFSSAALQAVTSLTGSQGPDYLFLTHVDDTADHGKWAQEFPNLKRIFHSGDLGQYNWIGDKTLEQVEILLPSKSNSDSGGQTATSKGLTAYSLDGDILPDDWNLSLSPLTHPVVILHTPGHSPGSITLYKRPRTTTTDPDNSDKSVEQEDDPGVLFTGDTYAYATREGSYMTGFPRFGNDLRQQSETLMQLLELEWDVIAPGHGHPRDYRGISNKHQVQEQEMQVALNELEAFYSPARGKWN